VTTESQALLGALETLAALIAAKVVAELRAGDAPGMVDQVASPLGRRRHIAAVRRLVATGQPGAAQVGRRYLLSRERLDAELAGNAKALKPSAKHVEPMAAVPDELAALRNRYAKAGAR
jgi:hypothetical protein